MGNDTVLHVTIGLIAAAAAGVFTAGGFYIYVQMSLKHIEERIREGHALLEERAKDVHRQLDQKIDKNFETQEKRIEENKRELLADLAGIGGKVSFNERTAARRHLNTLAAVIIAAPTIKEHDISVLMKES